MNDARAVALLIEDDPHIRRFVHTALASQGYEVIESANGERGLTEAAARKPDLVILDLGLPDMDGIQVLHSLREWASMPVIVLSARAMESAKIMALDSGADDYLTKPFGAGELLARVRTALRHATATGEQNAGVLTVGGLQVDLIRRKVVVDGREIHLTPIEYGLLAILIRNAGKVITHRQLLREIWGPSHVEDNHYVRIYMAQLRHKLEKNPAQPRYLVTETGVGYRFAEE
ncbi:MAG: response regulator [Gammaproteobacteria bacterium]|nr:response regulator [Gammaproteobacteria bacterium]